MAVAFLLHGLFVDEEIRCLELGAACVRDGYQQFLNDENDDLFYEYIPVEWLSDPPTPYPTEENLVGFLLCARRNLFC